MAANGTTRGGGLFNVALQVLKFVLLALAMYSMSLSQQLGIKLPARLALVDATPQIQNSRDGSFKIAFYALHFLEDYQQLGLKVYFKNEDNTDGPVLSSITLNRKAVPFYSEEMKLPDLVLKGKYSIGYEITFDKKMDAEGRKSTGKSYQIVYDPFLEPDVIIDVPISIRRGQRAPLPGNLKWLELRPVDAHPVVTIEPGGNTKWLRAGRIKSEYQKRQFAYTSQMSVLEKTTPGNKHCFTTRNSVTQQAGPVVCLDNKTAYKGTINTWDAIQNGDRVAFIGSLGPDGVLLATNIIVSRDQEMPEGVVELGVTVLENEPPRSAYAQDGASEVTLFTSWIFWDTELSMRFLNLNRYIIDPDGLDARDQPDIRVRRLSLAGKDPRFEIKGVELKPPLGSGIEFRLYFNQDLEQVFKGINTLEIPCTANDDANEKVLTLKIAKDYISK